jgi:hypothetical protein
MSDTSSPYHEEPDATSPPGAHAEDALEVATLRAALQRLDPLNRPVPRLETGRRRRTPGYRTRSLLGAGLLLLVVTLALDTDKQLPVIELGAGIATGESNTTSDKMLAGAPALSAMWTPNLVLAEGVGLPAGEGVVYRIGDLDEDRLQQFSDVLAPGLATERVPASEGGGWRSTTTDGIAAFTITKNGSWWYSAVSAGISCVPVTPEPRPTDSAPGTPDTPTPDTPMEEAGCVMPRRVLPTDKDARRIVTDIVDELRLGAGDASIEYRDDWSLTVRWDPRIPDVQFGAMNPFSLRFGLGENGVIEYAGGQSGSLDRVGVYPTVSAADALVTLNGSHSSPEILGVAADCQAHLEEPAIAAPAIAAPDEVQPGPPVPAIAAGTEDAIKDPSHNGSADGGKTGQGPAVSEPFAPACGARTTLRVTEVTRVHNLIWDAAGTGWLVPAYEYTTADGGIWIADALPERYLDRGSRAEDQPQPASDTDEGTSSSSPGWPGVEGLIGMVPADVERLALDVGMTVRVVTEDGIPQAGTKDFREDRVNLVVESDRVTDAWLG